MIQIYKLSYFYNSIDHRIFVAYQNNIYEKDTYH